MLSSYMKKVATLSSKNQITVPAEVRSALHLKPGEAVVFDVDVHGHGPRVTLHRYPTLEELAGSVPVPPEVANLTWDDIRARAWTPEQEVVGRLSEKH
jgi:AbrB family looped-hinge helix DNA binding protein